MAGVGAGLVLMYAGPYAARLIGQPPQGLMYRGIQAGVALGASWAAKNFRLLGPGSANAIATYGVVFAVLGALSDFMHGSMTAAAPPPSALGLSGTGYYEPYGPGLLPYGITEPAGMGYYDAVA